METVQLDSVCESGECRLCLMSDPVDDLIRPCLCSGSVRYTHRRCLDRWRTVSPHPDSLTTCEICKSNFSIIRKTRNDDCWRQTKFVLAIGLDLAFFLGLMVGLWLAFGYVGDKVFNPLVQQFPCDKTTCEYFQFTHSSLWSGRIWFWGFIWFFFTIGCIGCCVGIYTKLCGSKEYNTLSSSDYYRRNDCYWICCGPSYYDGIYYGPYSNWGSNDILCCWLYPNSCMPHNHHHYYGSYNNDCNLGNCNAPDCKLDGDGLVILVIAVIVVIIFVICGLIFGSIVGFLIVNKIVKRHLHIVEKKNTVEYEIVADLDDPAQVEAAETSDCRPDEPLVENEQHHQQKSKVVDDL